MALVLVIYDSRTGNTEKVAGLVAEGVKEVEGIECVLKKVDNVSLDDLLKADGVIIGSPTYYGTMSGKIKELLDMSVKLHGKLEGKVGAAFTTSGGTASGAETTILSILEALLIHGMIVQGNPHRQHYGLAVVGTPDAREMELCRRFGTRTANLVAKIAKAQVTESADSPQKI
ncbi:MAG: NAD(P)H-dependent oxidoreductase [Nitrososphaerota archaeon]